MFLLFVLPLLLLFGDVVGDAGCRCRWWLAVDVAVGTPVVVFCFVPLPFF